jgi:adenine phosphoribosyltransferase
MRRDMATGASTPEAVAERVRARLRDVQDFPKPGIVFKDITPVLSDARLFAEVIAAMAEPFRSRQITHIAAIESRGFLLAAPLALALGAGVIPIRKPGKLPARTASRAYGLEYGTDRLEVHVDACPARSRILLVDDVLATGGTAEAAAELIEEVGGTVVACAFLLSIGSLGGKKRLAGRETRVLVPT